MTRIPGVCRLIVFIALLSLPSAPIVGTSAAQSTTVIVVRHAEKATDDPRDPALSDEGEKRAATLMKALSDIAIGAVYTTQFRRTRQTAESVAASHGIEVQPIAIDASNAETYADDLANRIRTQERGGNVLIVGHSNTVPAIVHALCGVDIGEMAEDQYDRLFIVTLPSDAGQQAQLIRARYGAASNPP